jgi:hypothetical protein
LAGETRGELAEAIAKVAVENALKANRTKETVFWEESPLNSTIKPDLTIGIDKDHPSHVILVNASDTARNSDIKYWRNIGEIFDSKSRLQSGPAILNIVFKSQIKPELVTLRGCAKIICPFGDFDFISGVGFHSSTLRGIGAF